MCLAVYLAADHPLPLIPWRKDAPGFSVTERVPDPERVRAHVSRPRLRSVWTASGCGCGFLYDGVAPGTAEYTEVRAAYRQLSDYLQRHAHSAPIELYACWGGDEALPTEGERAVAAHEIAHKDFILMERELVRVRQHPRAEP